MSYFPDFIRQSMMTGGQGGGGSRGGSLDFATPTDNLYAFAKLWSTLDAQPMLSSFHGTMFAMVGNQKLQPLFGYAGIGNFQARIEQDGAVRMRGKETGYFTDLATGDVLETWDNPFTGETVEVYNFLNDRIRGVLGAEMPVYSFGEEGDEPTLMNETSGSTDGGSVPFILPWEFYGDRVHLGWDYTHRYTNPLSPDKYPKASTGKYINPSEHFTFTTSLAELSDRSKPYARYTAGFSRLSPWWPWMMMGQSGVEGVLFGRMTSVKDQGRAEDVPRKILDYTEKHYPQYLEPCDDWDDGGPISTWEAYARDISPEINE
ncbi:MAG: DUF1838 family protein [Pseudomonadales bacterium]